MIMQLATKMVLLKINTIETNATQQKLKIENGQIGIVSDIDASVSEKFNINLDDKVIFTTSKKNITFENDNQAFLIIPVKNIISRVNQIQ